MKYCGEQGCRNLISKGRYCEQHRRRRKKAKNNYKHKNKSLYNSAVWKRLTSYIYEREKGLCQRCGKFVFGKQAHNHHIIPVAVDPTLELEPDNIRLLCPECHIIEEHEDKQDNTPSYFKS